MKITHNELFYIIPHYLPLKNFSKSNGKYIIELGAGETYKKLKLDSTSMEILKKFTQPHTISEIQAFSQHPKEMVKMFCERLINEKILVLYKEVPDNYKRYGRHLEYYALHDMCPISAQDKLKDISITLIGAGGIGNWISMNLVGLGIRKIRLVDPDLIEESNLTRQVLFSEKDVGKLKVDVAANQLRQRNKNLMVEAINETVTSTNVSRLIQDTNFVVLSADRPFFAIQKWLNNECLKLKIPLINVGYAAGDGIMGPLVIPEVSACLACNSHVNDDNYYFGNSDPDAELFSNHFISPSFSCLNSLISCMASYEIIKFLLGFGECITINNIVQISPLDFSIKKISCKRNNKCTVCHK